MPVRRLCTRRPSKSAPRPRCAAHTHVLFIQARRRRLTAAVGPIAQAYFQNRALVRTTMAKYAEAIEDCQSALAINPTSSKAYGRMGKAYFSASDYNSSVTAYEKALELDPNNATYVEVSSARSNCVCDALLLQRRLRRSPSSLTGWSTHDNAQTPIRS